MPWCGPRAEARWVGPVLRNRPGFPNDFRPARANLMLYPGLLGEPAPARKRSGVQRLNFYLNRSRPAQRNDPCFGGFAARRAASSSGVALRCRGGFDALVATAASRSATMRSQIWWMCNLSHCAVLDAAW